uniref:Pectate lyase superfamily protein domain-containing protein n=1 Tax=Brassica campestris TaxID=3711 RepID=M4ETK6_BRACM
MPKMNPQGIYVDKNLRLDNIQVYGFDYDYTLAHYSSDLQSLIYDLAKQHMVNDFRYPESCMKFKYDPTFPIRGLYYDKQKGCLMKLDFFGSIEPYGCYFCRRKLSRKELENMYGTRHMGREQARVLVGLMDFFCFSEACLIADMVQYFVDAKLEFDASYIYNDVNRAIQHVHRSGLVHRGILADPTRYLLKNGQLLRFLRSLKDKGKKLFLMTNSPYHFVDGGMRYLMEESFGLRDSWRDLFDVVIAKANKPEFYTSEHPFRCYDEGRDTLAFTKVDSFHPDKIYYHGCLKSFLQITKWRGPEVIYFGDHLFSDLRGPSKAGWRTVAIIHELEMTRTSFVIVVVLAICSFQMMESSPDLANKVKANNIQYDAINCRKHSAVITEFGAVGDGKTSNTKAFKEAITKLAPKAADGGVQLIVPPGKWLTGSFNLTSHFTLFIQKDATILASQDESEYPVVAPLPSYGQGRDAAGPTFASLISGTNLTDVVITGNNGTINGQGKYWWVKYRSGGFKNITRPYTLELVFSKDVQISNITIVDSPAWNIHPVYCTNVIVKGVTILAPIDSPNTDGINPDSCTNTLIEDCFVVSGDDCIAVKSGWDQFGIKVGMPTQQLSIRRLTCISPDSAGIALGSEMSGGIKDVRMEDITLLQTQSAIRIKTAVGRGGYVKDIFARRFTMKTMKYVFWMSGAYNQHPASGFDPKAMPEITNINYRDMTADNVTQPARLDGFTNDPFTKICMSNINIVLAAEPKKLLWNCTAISGVSSKVTPKPCSLLPENAPVDCAFPVDKIPIESVVLNKCSA